MGINEVVAEILDKARRRAQAVEVYGMSSTSSPVEYEASRLKTILSAENSGVALRVVAGGKVGFSSTTKLDDIDTLVDNALGTAQFGAKADFDFAGPGKGPDVKVFDDGVGDLDVETLLDLGSRSVEEVKAYDPAIQVGAAVEKQVKSVCLMNSRGFAGEYTKSKFGFSIWGELTEGENMIWIWDSFARCKLGDAGTDTAAMTSGLIDTFRHARKNVRAEGGKYKVIVAPGAVPDLVQPLIACLNGKAVEKGVSPWKDKVGERLLDARFSMADDGTLPYVNGTLPFDDEGIPSAPGTLVADGVIQGFYTDLKTAGAIGQKPTGNGFRDGLQHQPAPGLSNLVLSAGSESSDKLLKGIDRGIYIRSLMGAWAGNPYSGEVSGNILLGFLIENGEIVGRIKDCMLAVNAFTLFRDQLVDMSCDRVWTDNIYTPYYLFDSVSINSKAD